LTRLFRETIIAVATPEMGLMDTITLTRQYPTAYFTWRTDLYNMASLSSDGSYYYKNSNGSKYYNSGDGYAQYTSPSGGVSKSTGK